MNVLINRIPHTLPEGATVADAIATIAARAPFAVAVNTRFVPQSRYAEQRCSQATRSILLPCMIVWAVIDVCLRQ